MSENAIEIGVGEVTDMEVRIFARYAGEADQVSLRGAVRGPFCEKARTLPAEFPFRNLGPHAPAEAEAIVTDPCLWSPELPHVYAIDVEALQGDRVVARYHDQIGLRRLRPPRPVDFAPGTG